MSGAECTKIARFSAAAAAIFTAPQKFTRFFEGPRCAISSAKKIASEPRFLLRIEWAKVFLAAEFPAIPSSAVKIASERRCAILVHSALECSKSLCKKVCAHSSFPKSAMMDTRALSLIACAWLCISFFS